MSVKTSESSGGYDNGIPHSTRARSDMSTEIADEGAVNPDDESTDTDDETGSLKAFKHVHVLQKPHSSVKFQFCSPHSPSNTSGPAV
jgi:hypothetical protein